MGHARADFPAAAGYSAHADEGRHASKPAPLCHFMLNATATFHAPHTRFYWVSAATKPRAIGQLALLAFKTHCTKNYATDSH